MAAKPTKVPGRDVRGTRSAVSVARGNSAVNGKRLAVGHVRQIGSLPVRVTTDSNCPVPASGLGAVTTASCSPPPEEYQGRSSWIRTVLPRRVLLIVRIPPMTPLDVFQLNAGTTDRRAAGPVGRWLRR